LRCLKYSQERAFGKKFQTSSIAFKLAIWLSNYGCKMLVMKLRLRNCQSEITIFLVAQTAKLYEASNQVAMDMSVEAVERMMRDAKIIIIRTSDA
jgi:hypothetical protein